MQTLKPRVRDWSAKLGLLPIPFLANDDRARYILMNGMSGNFCLDITEKDDRNEKRAGAWSSNVGHYVSIGKQHVEVLRYDSSSSVAETYNISSVEENLEGFHRYLEKSQPRAEMSVVSHVIRVFRQLRSTLNVADGHQPLVAFLTLLASVTDRELRRRFDPTPWGLPNDYESASHTLGEVDLRALSDELVNGRRFDHLTLKPELLLRHAAGQLFQEAHYEASIAQQLRFVGFTPSPSRPSKTKSGIGIHFTPPSLARMLVEQSIDLLDLKAPSIVIFDPACGSGEFLRESVRQLRLKSFKGKIQLIGWDISQSACDMAQFVLSWERRHDAGLLTINIKNVDSLAEEPWPDNVDLLLMNPPFVSYEAVAAAERDNIRSTMGSLARGRFDLSTVFVWKAVQSLKRNAVVGAILPSSFLESNAASPVREAISGKISLRLVARLGSQNLFTDALVDASALIAMIGDETNSPTTAFWADYRASSTSAGLRALRRATAASDHSPIVFRRF